MKEEICCNISPLNNYYNIIALDCAEIRRREADITSSDFKAIEFNARIKSGYNPKK